MKSIECPVSQGHKKYPQRPAVILSGGIISYSQLDEFVRGFQESLKRKGIKPKDRVGLCAVNSFEYVVALLALWRRKAVACPMSPRFPDTRIQQCFKQIKCKILIDLKPGPVPHPKLKKNFPIHLSQDATIIFTSGTTATPKAVLHTYGNHYFSARGANLNMTLKPIDRWLLSLPLYHVGGMGILFRVFFTGASLIVPDPRESLENSIEKYAPTHISLVPTQLYRLLQKSSNLKRLAKLKAILLGGGVIAPNLIKKSYVNKLPLHRTYGSTEMASQITATLPKASWPKFQTSGKTLPYRQTKISEEREILVKGKTLFKGYVQGRDLVKAFDRQGWFPTGDLGQIDRNGYLTILGRRDNMFISGGENIHPEEIEQCLGQMEGIDTAIVVPLKDQEFGCRPVAFLKLHRPGKIYGAQIQYFMERFLPRFKIPKTFFAWPNIPKNREGWKIDRKYLASLARKLISPS